MPWRHTMEELWNVMIATFAIVFVGELGDKTQAAAGTGALANRGQTWWIFAGSSLALICVSGLTTFAAGFIPVSALPWIQKVGGLGLFLYGIYLFRKMLEGAEEEDSESNTKIGWKLFWTQFSLVFLAELGDKTQIFTAGAAVANASQRLAVFVGSASALVAVTGLTVWGISFVPPRMVKFVEIGGIVSLMMYGLYMLFS